MNPKTWLIALITFIVIGVLSIEAFYQTHKYNRHYVDYLINTKLDQLKNKEFETIILGDSLAHNAIGALKLHSYILDLTSNNALSVAGNYFLLKRYLKQNKKPKNLYYFVVPGHLYQNLDTQYTYSYFTTVFTQEDEIENIQKIKPNLFKEDYSFSKYTEKRLKALKFWTHYNVAPKKSLPIQINENDLIKKENFMNAKIENKIKYLREMKNIINVVPKKYIDRIVTLCNTLDINFILVIEPIPKLSNKLFLQSDMYKFLQEKNIFIYNINDIYTFNNYFFRYDGRHIRAKVNQYYQNLIDENIVDIY